MTVLVAYAGLHGATAGIAERVAAHLSARAYTPGARPGDDANADNTVVVGSAAYIFHWLQEATAFVRRYRAVLVERPVWLASSGPTGTDAVDE